MKVAEEYCPSDKEDWRKWLKLNHTKKEAVWLIFYKKKSPNHNLSWSESVDEALCFGWIDSTKRTIDSTKYFDSLSKSVKKILLHWIVSAKRKETRQKRILEILENASDNLKPKQFR